MLLPRRMRREAQVRLPIEAAINRTFVIDLQLSVAAVIPDYVRAPGAIGGDASGEVEAEQRIARIIRQATIGSPGFASQRRRLERRNPVGRKLARFDALHRLIGSGVYWRSDMRAVLRCARLGHRTKNSDDDADN